MSVNLASMNNKDKNSNTEKQSSNSYGAQAFGQGSRGNFRGKGRNGFFRGCGRGRNFGRGRNYVVCQVCFKPGHATSHCFLRFDQSF